MDNIPITNVTLPPKSGYIEIEMPSGVRTYKNVLTGELLENEQGLDRLKYARIQQSKTDLAAYLESHPIFWTDGEYYSITQEKQAQLTSTLVCAQADGEPPEWNSTGGVCRKWDTQELTALGIAIKNRVKALVKYQQTQEVVIRQAATREELDAIKVDYDSVKETEV